MSARPDMPAPAIAAPIAGRVRSAGDRRRRDAGFAIGIGILAVVVVACVLVRLFWAEGATAVQLQQALESPSPAHLFGTDNLGRDLLVRTLYASMTDLTVGVVATYLPLLMGIVIGAVAGYLGGWVDGLLMRATDFVLAFPFMVLIVAIIAIVGPGLTGVFVGLVVKGFAPYARLARGEMLVLREEQYILAARTLGYSRRRIVFRHALPHVIRPCLVFSLSDLVWNMLWLASLSFLGLGVQPPTPEWGSIIADGQPYLLTAWWISALPGVFVVVVGVALSLVGEGLADRLHVRTAGVR